jgi:hypothetical protein
MEYVGSLGDLLAKVERLMGITITDEVLESIKRFYGLDLDDNLYTEEKEEE